MLEVYAAAETHVGIIAANLPLMQPVVVHLFGRDSKLRSSLKFDGSSGGSGGSGVTKKKSLLPSFKSGRGSQAAEAQMLERKRENSEYARRLTNVEPGTEMYSRTTSTDVVSSAEGGWAGLPADGISTRRDIEVSMAPLGKGRV